MVKDIRQLGCVLQNVEPPESVAISRKGTKVLGPIRRVRFTRGALRQAHIRDNEGPSLGKMQVKLFHPRSPYAEKFEDRSQEETERQERCARGDAWRLAKNIYKLKEKEKATFCSPTNEWILPAASTIKPEEREFVVDSGASMPNWKPSVSKSPTTVVIANDEVQTKEEATVYVRELNLFVIVMLLQDTLAVLSLGKLCEDHGYNYLWTSGQKPHLIKNGRKIDCNTANNEPFVVLGLHLPRRTP